MKAVILAGGYGTRISEESQFKPKPMIEIGEMPILWHIMKELSFYGINDFVICAGYKQHVIKEWFADYFLHTSDITFDFSKGNEIIVHNKRAEAWRVTVVDTGLNTLTGGRVKRIKNYVDNRPFLLTYGDAVSDVNVNKILELHKSRKRISTISVYNFAQNKGVVRLNDDLTVAEFREKSSLDSELINIGYMILEPKVFEYIQGDSTDFEKDVMEVLAEQNEVNSYIHKGFWQCMDTMREKQKLEKLWESGKAPWKVWED